MHFLRNKECMRPKGGSGNGRRIGSQIWSRVRRGSQITPKLDWISYSYLRERMQLHGYREGTIVCDRSVFQGSSECVRKVWYIEDKKSQAKSIPPILLRYSPVSILVTAAHECAHSFNLVTWRRKRIPNMANRDQDWRAHQQHTTWIHGASPQSWGVAWDDRSWSSAECIVKARHTSPEQSPTRGCSMRCPLSCWLPCSVDMRVGYAVG
jgi:hypothetical protein